MLLTVFLHGRNKLFIVAISVLWSLLAAVFSSLFNPLGREVQVK